MLLHCHRVHVVPVKVDLRRGLHAFRVRKVLGALTARAQRALLALGVAKEVQSLQQHAKSTPWEPGAAKLAPLHCRQESKPDQFQEE